MDWLNGCYIQQVYTLHSRIVISLYVRSISIWKYIDRKSNKNIYPYMYSDMVSKILDGILPTEPSCRIKYDDDSGLYVETVLLNVGLFVCLFIVYQWNIDWFNIITIIIVYLCISFFFYLTEMPRMVITWADLLIYIPIYRY